MSVYGDVPFRHPLFGGFYGLGFPRLRGGQDLFLNIGAPDAGPGVHHARRCRGPRR